MGLRPRCRIPLAALLLATTLGIDAAGADEIVVAQEEDGSEQRIEMLLANAYLDAGTISIVGPHRSILDSPPYFTEGPSGRSGADLTYWVDDALTCSFSESTPGWSVTVDPDASGATLTSTVPGCEGTIEFVGDVVPSIGVSVDVGAAPGDGQTWGSIGITTTRWATATGSFAGQLPDVLWAQISYTRIVNPGVGLPLLP